MKLFLLTSFSMIILQSIAAQKHSSIKYFEGIVEYDIKSESYMQGVPDNEIRERTGSKLKLYFKEGNYIREYVDDAGYTIKKFMYLKDSNQFYYYSLIASPDTLYFMDAAERQDESFTITTGQSASILDCKCLFYKISEKNIGLPLSDTAIITTSYYFCPGLPVNPDWSKDMYLWKDVIKQAKSIAIKFIEDYQPFFKETNTATKITWQPLADELFKINPKLIQAKMPKQ